MIKTVLIDDEANNIETLRNFIGKYCLDLQICATAKNVKQGIEIIKKHNPELVFLDIEMPDGTGFDILESLNDINFQLIFVTAYDNYAIKAFRYSALDYILKPVNPEILIKAVQKVKENLKQSDIEKKIENLFMNFKHKKQETIALPTSQGINIEKISDIICCISDSNYTTLYFRKKTKIMVSRSLKYFDELLSDNDFFRIHQKYLINLKHLTRYIKGDGGHVIMSDGKKLDVSRRRKLAFTELLIK